LRFPLSELPHFGRRGSRVADSPIWSTCCSISSVTRMFRVS
jgi:hypothetical protein